MQRLFLDMLNDPERRFRINIFFVFLLLTFFIRFPFFFLSTINWDEGTFILMGQSVLDGNLPYVKYWDLKPPLAFYPYAFFIWLFGHSIIAIRLGGALCVLAAGYLTFRIGEHAWGRKAGVIGGVMCICFSSFMPGGQSTMTEIITIVPLTGALAVLTIGKESFRTFFITGFLLSVAALMRLELAYFAIFLGGGLLVKSWLTKSFPPRYFYYYVIGGFIPVGMTALPYIVIDNWNLLIDSAITAPWIYANARPSTASGVALLIGKFFSKNYILFWFGALAGIPLIIKQWKTYVPNGKKSVVYLALFFFGVAFAIYKNGGSYGHHTIQMAPFIGLLSGQFYANAFEKFNKVIITTGIVIGLLISAPLLPEAYINMKNKLANNIPLRWDNAYMVAESLREINPHRESTYLTDFHIVYWLNRLDLPSKLVHPANMTEDIFIKLFFGPNATAKSEMEKLLRKKPRFIVKSAKNWYLRNSPEAHALLEKALRTDYLLTIIVFDALIFERRQ